jgi:hypothetical protein
MEGIGLMLDRTWAVETYDRIVAELGTPTVAESRVEFAERYAEAVAAGRIQRVENTVHDEGVRVFGLVIEPERNARRQSLVRTIAHLTDSLFSGQWRDVEPALDVAYPLGNGADKTLAAWTPEDYRQAIMTRYRGAAEQTASASEADATISAFVQQMEIRGAFDTVSVFSERVA